MSVDMPDGPDPAEVRGFAIALGSIGDLINATSTYLTADDGSTDQSEAEDALEECLDQALARGAEASGRVILTFASLIVQAGNETTVQEWFDQQAARIAPFLTEVGSIPTEDDNVE